MKPTLEQILDFAAKDLDEPPPPSPYEISLRLACALLAGGAYPESPEAAVGAGWAMVLPYYRGISTYEQSIRAAAEAADHAAKARYDVGSFAAPDGFMPSGASVAEGHGIAPGGELGGAGSAAFVSTSMDIRPTNPELMQKRQAVIHSTGLRVAETAKALDAAQAAPKGKGRAAALAKAEDDHQQALQAQSASYEMPWQ